jgi:hypothetical protein
MVTPVHFVDDFKIRIPLFLVVVYRNLLVDFSVGVRLPDRCDDLFWCAPHELSLVAAHMEKIPYRFYRTVWRRRGETGANGFGK